MCTNQIKWWQEETIVLKIQAKIEIFQPRFGEFTFWDWRILPDGVLALNLTLRVLKPKGKGKEKVQVIIQSIKTQPSNSERKKQEKAISNQIYLIQQLAKI